MEIEKRECILQAASRAFSRFGFKKASIDEIAKAAGVAKGTVYLACESKEDLFYQAVHRDLRGWISECSKLIDPRVNADKLLETVVRASVVYLGGKPLVRDLLSGTYGKLLPAWEDRMNELRVLGRANTTEILALGIKQGRFRKDLDIDLVASLLQDLHIASYLFHGKELSDKPELWLPRFKAALDLLLHGLMTPKASAEAIASG